MLDKVHLKYTYLSLYWTFCVNSTFVAGILQTDTLTFCTMKMMHDNNNNNKKTAAKDIVALQTNES